MKRFLGYIIDKGIKAIPRKKKVSPTIKSVKPTKDIKGSIKKTKSDLEYKNLENVGKLRKQKEEGIKSARKASRELQRAAETKRATKIGKQYFARSVPPRSSDLNNPTVVKTKKFKKGKELEREKKMGGGMMGRRMGYAMGESVKFDAKKSDLDKSGDLSKYEKARGMAIAKAMAKRKNKKKAT